MIKSSENFNRDFFISLIGEQGLDLSFMVKSVSCKIMDTGISGSMSIFDQYDIFAEGLITTTFQEHVSGGGSSGGSSLGFGVFSKSAKEVLQINPNNRGVPYKAGQCTLYVINTVIAKTNGTASGDKYASWAGGVSGYHLTLFTDNGSKLSTPGISRDGHTAYYDPFVVYGFKDLGKVRSGDVIVFSPNNSSMQHTAIIYYDSDGIWRLNENSAGHVINSRTLASQIQRHNGNYYILHTLLSTNPDGTPRNADFNESVVQQVKPSQEMQNMLEEASKGSYSGVRLKLQFGYIEGLQSPVYSITVCKVKVSVDGDFVNLDYDFVGTADALVIADKAETKTYPPGPLNDVLRTLVNELPGHYPVYVDVGNGHLSLTPYKRDNKKVIQYIDELIKDITRVKEDGEVEHAAYDMSSADGGVYIGFPDDFVKIKTNNVKYAYSVGGVNNEVISFSATMDESAPTAPGSGTCGYMIDNTTGKMVAITSNVLKNSMSGSVGIDLPTGSIDKIISLMNSLQSRASGICNKATLQILGNPNIELSDTIEVDVFLNGGIRHYSSGQWSVNSVSHSISDGGFETTLDLSRNVEVAQAQAFTDGGDLSDNPSLDEICTSGNSCCTFEWGKGSGVYSGDYVHFFYVCLVNCHNYNASFMPKPVKKSDIVDLITANGWVKDADFDIAVSNFKVGDIVRFTPTKIGEEIFYVLVTDVDEVNKWNFRCVRFDKFHTSPTIHWLGCDDIRKELGTNYTLGVYHNSKLQKYQEFKSDGVDNDIATSVIETEAKGEYPVIDVSSNQPASKAVKAPTIVPGKKKVSTPGRSPQAPSNVPIPASSNMPISSDLGILAPGFGR